MKIGIDARLWDQTGVGRYIRNLVQNLLFIDKNNTYVLFVRKQDYENIKNSLFAKASRDRQNPKWKIVIADIRWHSLSEQINFPKVLEKENLDLMHFPYFSLPIFYNKPYVVTIHDLIINHFPTGKASTLLPILYYLKLFSYKYIISKGAKNAKKIFTPSNATKEEIIDHLKVNENKITVTPEAADENFINHKSEIINKKYGKYFLYVGNAYPHKNLQNLLYAFKKTKEEIKDVKLILVGNKDYFYKKLEESASKLNLEDDIIFYGLASDKDLSFLYKNAICLVMPSLMEGFGLPIVEAMVNKCLVVCSDIPSLREIAKGNAIYFSPKNELEISNALKKAYSKDFDKEIIENAFKLSKEFSWEKMAKETLRVYESFK